MSRTRAFFHCAHLVRLRGILFALLACLLAIGAPPRPWRKGLPQGSSRSMLASFA